MSSPPLERPAPTPYAPSSRSVSPGASASHAPPATRRRQVDALFDSALDQATDVRAGWLAAACGDDVALRDEVAALLAAHARAGGVLDGDPGALLGGAAVAAIAPLTAARARLTHAGPWRLLAEIGRGGMGTVWAAERDDGQFRQRAAVKLLGRAGDDGDAATGELARRFAAERQILAALDHPHVARVLDGGVAADGRPYLVMELVEGERVDRWCDARRLDVDARLRLFLDVCRAVAHAHARLVVHRDIKPANVLVTATGEAKLLDFGIAKLLDGSPLDAAPGAPADETRTGHHPMTPAYASPEQVRGTPVTTATDVYGLGLVLYELLCGRPAHRLGGGSYEDVVRAVVTDEPARPSAAARAVVSASTRTTAPAHVAPHVVASAASASATPADVPTDGADVDDAASVAAARGTTPARLARRLAGDLDRIVLRALHKDSARRYPSAEALARDLERHLAGLPVEARGDSPAYRAGRFVRRHRWALGAAGAFVALLAVMAVTATAQALRERQLLALSRQETARAEQVSRFLLSMFAAGDPGEERGTTLTARELLRRAAAEAERRSDEPLVQAELFDVVGRAHQQLGEYALARPLLERGLRVRRDVLGDDHPDVARSRSHLGALLVARGDDAGAEAELRAALASGPEPAERAADLVRLAGVRSRRGDWAGAERLLAAVLAYPRDVIPDSVRAAALDQLAHAAGVHGDLATTTLLYRETLAEAHRTLGEERAGAARAAAADTLPHAALGQRRARLSRSAPVVREPATAPAAPGAP